MGLKPTRNRPNRSQGASSNRTNVGLKQRGEAVMQYALVWRLKSDQCGIETSDSLHKPLCSGELKSDQCGIETTMKSTTPAKGASGSNRTNVGLKPCSGASTGSVGVAAQIGPMWD